MYPGILNLVFGIRKAEFGLRPLRAVGYRLYEPEAIGVWTYAPVGRRILIRNYFRFYPNAAAPIQIFFAG